MTACDHDYSYCGVRYKMGDKVPGSGSRYVNYFESFFCKKCLDRRYVSLEFVGNSYDKLSFDATPIESGAVTK